MDTGDMIAIETVQVGPDETASELYDRLANLAGEMAGAWMPRIVAGDYPRTKQDDALATHAPKITRDDARLDFLTPIHRAYNQFRSVTQSPGAFLETSIGVLKIKSARMAETTGAQPGIVSRIKPELAIGFDGGELILLEVQPEGKRVMRGTDFANGARIRPGERLQKVESD